MHVYQCLLCRRTQPRRHVQPARAEILLNQFDSRWARNQHFLFLAFDQQCRHENIRSVTARVRSGHEYVEKFQKLMAQPNIVADLKYASEHPKTDESRKLMNKVMPVIKLAGQKTDWGPIARNVCVSKITAMVRLWFNFLSEPDARLQDINIHILVHWFIRRRKRMALRTISAPSGTWKKSMSLTKTNNSSLRLANHYYDFSFIAWPIITCWPIISSV